VVIFEKKEPPMKCPKCGYNSFEIHDACKKCAHDLTSYKDNHGLKSIVLPLATRTLMAEKLMAENAPDLQAAVPEMPADMFSFDIPEDKTAVDAGSFLKDDPFDFGDESGSTSFGEGNFSFSKEQMSAQAKAEEDAFADLLESIGNNKTEMPQAAKPAETNSQDRFDLSDFMWDDTPDTAPGEVSKHAENDFNNLFGKMDDSAHK
jgi:hypothetical protein